jgi:hypothetical protein
MGSRRCRIPLAVVTCLGASGAAFAVDLPSEATTEAALDRVFARPEFAPARENPAAGIFLRILRAIAHLLHEFWQKLERGLEVPWLKWLVLGAVVALLVAVLLRLVRTVLRPAAPLRGSSRSPSFSPGIVRERLEAASHLSAAADHAGAGRFLEAVQALYAGVVLWFDEAGHARYEPSKTGEDYARDLRTSTLSAPFRSLLRVFYPLEFGGRAATRDAYERMRAIASQLGVPS